jgi:glycosyltransferase involved in cell wall biosynthesis
VRVLIDTTYTRRGRSGTAVYVEQLVAALRDAGVDVVEAANERRRAPAGGGLGSARNLALDERWTQVQLPRLAREKGADVLHHPLPALAARAPCAQVVTLHDLAFERLPDHFAPAYRRFASLAHRRAARGAGAVVCVSETTRADARELWGIDDARIVVAPHGPGQPLEVTRSEPPAHFLYVGDDEPRKNLTGLLAGYARYRAAAGPDDALPLVLAGRASRQQQGVRHKPDPDLAGLLGAAAALVHPALHEGFGLTVLEAMHAGVPVIAARSPGLEETCADAVRYVDPRDAAGISAALVHLAADRAARDDLARRGAARAAEFSWEASARRHIEAYTLARSE